MPLSQVAELPLTICRRTVSGFLSLLPHSMVMRILFGPLRGKRWILRSSLHRCWMGWYEYEKQHLIAKALEKDSVFYDVGANVGFYSLLAANVARSGKVFSFEPSPRNLELLRKHLILNRIANVDVLDIAVSDINGSSMFQIEDSGLMGYLSPVGGLEVNTYTLDSLLQAGRIAPPDYVKIDVEGAELSVLRGGAECIQCHRPVIFLATHGPDAYRDCRTLLEAWGYTCCILEMSNAGGEIIALPVRGDIPSKSLIGKIMQHVFP